ncbi:MAG: hypothetical protein HZB22_01500 [Deltaproteobacteria bacterium]|nr:hypothetical protein [Deltaproteobacteria bacterium]
MKIYKLPKLAELQPDGAYRVGSVDAAGAGAVYLVYGRLRPKEASKKITTSEGCEEIFCVVKGNMKVRCGKAAFTVNSGEAFRSAAGQTFLLDNLDDEESIYIAAGGPSAMKEGVKTPVQTPPDAEKPVEIEACGLASASAEEETEFDIVKDDLP